VVLNKYKNLDTQGSTAFEVNLHIIK